MRKNIPIIFKDAPMRISDTFKKCTLALMSLAMGIFLLIHFICIWVYGKFYIYESNVLILILETTMMVAILCFSLFCLLEQLRQKK